MKIVILFGEMGAGKTYQGKRLANMLDFDFVEGDSFMPPNMAGRVAKFDKTSGLINI